MPLVSFFTFTTAAALVHAAAPRHAGQLRLPVLLCRAAYYNHLPPARCVLPVHLPARRTTVLQHAPPAFTLNAAPYAPACAALPTHWHTPPRSTTFFFGGGRGYHCFRLLPLACFAPTPPPLPPTAYCRWLVTFSVQRAPFSSYFLFTPYPACYLYLWVRTVRALDIRTFCYYADILVADNTARTRHCSLPAFSATRTLAYALPRALDELDAFDHLFTPACYLHYLCGSGKVGRVWRPWAGMGGRWDHFRSHSSADDLQFSRHLRLPSRIHSMRLPSLYPSLPPTAWTDGTSGRLPHAFTTINSACIHTYLRCRTAHRLPAALPAPRAVPSTDIVCRPHFLIARLLRRAVYCPAVVAYPLLFRWTCATRTRPRATYLHPALPRGAFKHGTRCPCFRQDPWLAPWHTLATPQPHLREPARCIAANVRTPARVWTAFIPLSSFTVKACAAMRRTRSFDLSIAAGLRWTCCCERLTFSRAAYHPVVRAPRYLAYRPLL